MHFLDQIKMQESSQIRKRNFGEVFLYDALTILENKAKNQGGGGIPPPSPPIRVKVNS